MVFVIRRYSVFLKCMTVCACLKHFARQRHLSGRIAQNHPNDCISRLAMGNAFLHATFPRACEMGLGGRFRSLDLRYLAMRFVNWAWCSPTSTWNWSRSVSSGISICIHAHVHAHTYIHNIHMHTFIRTCCVKYDQCRSSISRTNLLQPSSKFHSPCQ